MVRILVSATISLLSPCHPASMGLYFVASSLSRGNVEIRCNNSVTTVEEYPSSSSTGDEDIHKHPMLRRLCQLFKLSRLFQPLCKIRDYAHDSSRHAVTRTKPECRCGNEPVLTSSVTN